MSIRRAGICKRTERLKCRWGCLKQQWTCTFHINLVGFHPALLQLMRLNSVQLASISTLVNSSTFTRGQHFCASIPLARGRHCYAGRAMRWPLPRLSSSIYLLLFYVAHRRNKLTMISATLVSHVLTYTKTRRPSSG